MDKRNLAIGIFKAAIVMVVFLVMCVPASAQPPPAPPAPIYSNWATVAPSIDGNFSAGEWKNAQLLIDSPIHTYVHFSNTGEYLFVGVNAADGAGGDYTENDTDYCTLHFDTDHDEIWTDGHEDAFVLYGNGSTEHWVANSGRYTLHCTDWATNHPGLQAAAGFGSSPNAATPHRIYEFKIPLKLVTATSPGETLGFASPIGWDSLPHDAATGEHNIWPPGATMDMSTWGDLILALPPQAPILTPIGIIALISLLATMAAFAIVRKRR